MAKKIISLSMYLFFAVFVVSLSGYYIINKIESNELREKQRQKVLSERDEIDLFLHKLVTIGENIVEDIESGSETKESLIARLKKEIDKDPEVFGIGIAFAPYRYSADTKLFCPYYKKVNGTHEYSYVEEQYDYTLPDCEWYNNAISHDAMWHEPFYGRNSAALVTLYTVPFYLPDTDRNTSPDGVIFVTYSLDALREKMKSLSLESGGYGVLLSQSGKMFYHPNTEIMYNLKNIFEVADEYGSEDLRELSEHAVKGESGSKDYFSVINYLDVVVFYEPFENIGWSLLGVVIKEEIEKVTRRDKLLVFMSLLSFVCFLHLLAYRVLRNREWTLSTLSSLFLVTAIIFIWTYNQHLPLNANNEEHLLAGESTYEIQINDYIKNSNNNVTERPVTIPTGVFVQSVELKSAINFTITGYIWQTYTDEQLATITPGVLFPEAEDIELEKEYEKKYGDETVIGWHFNASIRERFDYSKYPFDREQLWLRMWHREFDKNIILTPDLKSYDYINPYFLPGLEKDFVLPGWKIIKTYFSYVKNDYSTNFGIRDYKGQENFPELYYNIQINRHFINPFITDLVPIVVVMLMLFATVALGRREDIAGKIGFNSLAVVSACSALFFVVIYNHVNIRTELATSGIVYMEYFYFITYAAILFVSVNSILVSLFSKNKIIAYKDNLFARLLFWPVSLGIIFLITYFVFL